MEVAGSHEVTSLLSAIGAGDATASERLLPVVYEELRALARAQMAREPAGHTLQPTALVHEAYLRLVGGGTAHWNSRGHFFGAAAQAMRRILVERARRHAQLKRGGDRDRVALEDEIAAIEPPEELDMVALDSALDRLRERDPRKAEIVMLRFFAGLGVEETASALEVSASTVKSEWMYARAWLLRDMDRGPDGAPA